MEAVVIDCGSKILKTGFPIPEHPPSLPSENVPANLQLSITPVPVDATPIQTVVPGVNEPRDRYNEHNNDFSQKDKEGYKNIRKRKGQATHDTQSQVEGRQQRKTKRPRQTQLTKKTILDDWLPKDATQRKKRLRYRSNLHACITCLDELQPTDQQKQIFKQHCPFWELVDSILNGRVTKDRTKKSDHDVKELIKNFQKKNKKFEFQNINDKSLEITIDDIVNTFGVKRGSKIVDLKYSSRPNTKIGNCFDDLKKLTTKAVRDKLLGKAKEGTKDSDFLTCQLLTLYMLAVLFVSSTDGIVSWGYLRFLAYLEKMNSYDWAEHIHRMLICSLVESKYPDNVSGCVMVIPFWVMEHFPVTTNCKNDARLLCEKWDISEVTKQTMYKATTIIDVLQATQQAGPSTQPTTRDIPPASRNKRNANKSKGTPTAAKSQEQNIDRQEEPAVEKENDSDNQTIRSCEGRAQEEREQEDEIEERANDDASESDDDNDDAMHEDSSIPCTVSKADGVEFQGECYRKGSPIPNVSQSTSTHAARYDDLVALKSALKEAQESIKNLESVSNDKEKEIERLNKTLTDLGETSRADRGRANMLEVFVRLKGDRIDQLEKEIDNLDYETKVALCAKDVQISELGSKVHTLVNIIKEDQNKIMRLDEEISVKLKGDRIDQLEKEIDNLDYETKASLCAKDIQISELGSKIHTLVNIIKEDQNKMMRLDEENVRFHQEMLLFKDKTNLKNIRLTALEQSILRCEQKIEESLRSK